METRGFLATSDGELAPNISPSLRLLTSDELVTSDVADGAVSRLLFRTQASLRMLPACYTRIPVPPLPSRKVQV